jgi:FixJ family two-component response regulator
MRNLGSARHGRRELGSGLSFCCSIVECHDGAIRVYRRRKPAFTFRKLCHFPIHMTPPDLSKPTVFVVDDDQAMRDSLVDLLDTLDVPVMAFGAPGNFHRFYRPEMPGCLLLDVHMPRQTGLELYETLLAEGKRLPVIFITARADVATAVAAMKIGAIEFLEKPIDRETLQDRVRKALALDAEWRAGDAQFAELADRIARLSPRERETLAKIEAGESNKSMAAKLHLTERAVEMRRSAIMRKLGVGSVAELVDLTVTHRILADVRQAARSRSVQ